MKTALITKYLLLQRKKHGYTQESLARELHISRQAISRWETGNAIPDLEVLLKLSKLYGITINDILEPHISTPVLDDFEKLQEVDREILKAVMTEIPVSVTAAALMGSSPTMNTYIADLFPDIDFANEQNQIGRIKIEEVENAQNEIISLLNLSLTS